MAAAGGADDEWIVLNTDDDDDWIVSEIAGLLHIRTSYAKIVGSQSSCLKKARPTWPAKKSTPRKEAGYFEEEKDDVIFQKWTKTKHGKSLCKGGLVRRYQQGSYSSYGCGSNADVLQLVGRRPKFENLFGITQIDELVPELLTRQSATLNRANRWSTVRELFEDLVKDGKASVMRVPEGVTWGVHNDIPQYVERYVVQVEKYVHFAIATDTRRSLRRQFFARRDKTIYHYVRHRLQPWYELSNVIPCNIVAARKKFEDTKHAAFFEPLRGTLRATPKRGGTLSKREARAFAPSVAAACGAPCQYLNVRAAYNGVADSACELNFGADCFVTFVVVSGKIHETIRIITDEIYLNDETILPRFRYGEVVYPNNGARQGLMSAWLALDGTDAYCERFRLSARIGKEWIDIGEFSGPSSGREEIAVSLAHTNLSTIRDAGIAGVECSALRFYATSWQRAPALRVGAYGCNFSTKGKVTYQISKDDDADHDTVTYHLRSSVFDSTKADMGKIQLMRNFALKPHKTQCHCSYGRYNLRKRSFKRKLQAKEISESYGILT